jgi:hypothetical protein
MRRIAQPGLEPLIEITQRSEPGFTQFAGPIVVGIGWPRALAYSVS